MNRFQTDKEGKVTLWDTQENRPHVVYPVVAREILKSQASDETPRYIEKTVHAENSEKEALLEMVREEIASANGDQTPPPADPTPAVATREEVIEAAKAIAAEAAEGTLNENGNPTKAAVEARLGKAVEQGDFLAALKQV